MRWQQRVTELSIHQLRDLRERIKLRLPDNVDAAGRKLPTLEDDWLLSGMVSRMVTRGITSRARVKSLLRGREYATYAQTAEQLRADLEKLAEGANLSQSQARELLTEVVTDAIVSWLTVRRMTVSPGMVLTNSARAYEALNACYPGYIASGMFHVVLTRRPA